MAANAGSIRAGSAYIEIFLQDNKLVRGLNASEARFKTWGKSVEAIGRGLVKFGTLAASPFIASTKVFADYESALASLRAAANPTADQLKTIESAISDISKSTGTGPAKVASAMTELLKAGMSLESVLGGAAEATLKFAKVAEMDAAEAATVLTDVMNVFGQSATATMDTMSKTADASSVSLRDVTLSLSQVSAVASNAGLSLDETATAIAILGQNMVKGSDAGTSLKTMLLRLQTGAGTTGDTMQKFGINVRNSNGSMKSMRGIIAELRSKLGGLSGQARDTALLDLFGTDAFRAGTILLKKGVAGWDEFTKKMSEGLPVAAKYEILMNTLSGFADRAWAAIQRLGIAVGEALGPMLGDLGKKLQVAMDALTLLVKNNKDFVVSLATGVAVVLGAGAAFVALGVAISGTGAVLGGIATVIGAVGAVFGAILSPLGLVVTGLSAATFAFFKWTDAGKQALLSLGSSFRGLKETATAAFGGIANALKAGDIGLAGKILWAGLNVEFIKGVNFLKAIWADWGTAFKTVISDAGFFVARAMTNIWADIRIGAIEAIGVIQDAWTVAVSGISTIFAQLVGKLTKYWNTFQIAFSAGLQEMAAELSGDFSAATRDAIEKKAARKITHENRRVDMKTATSVMKTEQARDATLNERGAARGAQVGGIEAERQQQIGLLDQGQATANDERFKAARDSITAGDAELVAAKAELARLIEEAKAKVPGATKDASSISKKGVLTPESIDAGLAKAQRSVEVKGSFSAAALRGIGTGDSLSDAVKEGTKESKKQTAELVKTRRAVENAGTLD